jgi:hypothetical protein
MHEPHERSAPSPDGLLAALGGDHPPDPTTLLTHARRLGFDLAGGAIALSARGAPAPHINGTALLARVAEGRILGLVPLTPTSSAQERAAHVAGELEAAGLRVALSAPRRDPALLHEAIREADLLVELATTLGASIAGQEETYRLLIGVLLRDPQELDLLRTRTIAPLAAYDAQHDTELLATVEMFLAHHGSTTDTAEAMRLHRHTVGYRLSRAQDVSGLSPYESDGRERLSLGLKAAQILAADGRRHRNTALMQTGEGGLSVNHQ